MRKTGGHWVGGTLHKLTTQPHPAKPPSLELSSAESQGVAALPQQRRTPPRRYFFFGY